MPNPGDSTHTQLPAEDAFLGLLIETLDNLDRSARGQFLQRFFKTVTQLELTDTQSLDYWEQILARRAELSESMGKPISFKTAMVDVLASSNYLRVPILMEYEELKKLQINAATDPLTGLYNRRLFEEYFEKELNRARRYGQSLALVILDLHRFKEVNDHYGHLQGDKLLQAAASTLLKSLRTSDYAFRIGGDEFALLLPQSDAEQAATISRRVRTIYASATEPMRLDVGLDLDYGFAVFPHDGDQKEVLIRVADERLYQLKLSTRAHAAQEPEPAPPAAPSPTAAPGIAPGPERTEGPPAPPKTGAERRRWERVLLAGTRAYALLSDVPERTARVLDLGYGGVALQADSPEEMPASFHAVLHVPILPPVRVSLQRVYLQREGMKMRVGCAFVS